MFNSCLSLPSVTVFILFAPANNHSKNFVLVCVDGYLCPQMISFQLSFFDILYNSKYLLYTSILLVIILMHFDWSNLFSLKTGIQRTLFIIQFAVLKHFFCFTATLVVFIGNVVSSSFCILHFRPPMLPFHLSLICFVRQILHFFLFPLSLLTLGFHWLHLPPTSIPTLILAFSVRFYLSAAGQLLSPDLKFIYFLSKNLKWHLSFSNINCQFSFTFASLSLVTQNFISLVHTLNFLNLFCGWKPKWWRYCSLSHLRLPPKIWVSVNISFLTEHNFTPNREAFNYWPFISESILDIQKFISLHFFYIPFSTIWPWTSSKSDL